MPVIDPRLRECNGEPEFTENFNRVLTLLDGALDRIGDLEGRADSLEGDVTALKALAICAVTFDSNDGSAVTAQEVAFDGLATEPDDPTKEGYAFDAWYSDAELTTAYDFEGAVRGNITLYAGWIINQYTVTFNSDGGSAVASQTVDHGGVATEPTAPTKDAYVFEAWYLGASEYVFSTEVVADITLTAHWTEA